jgi:hypothetical protein
MLIFKIVPLIMEFTFDVTGRGADGDAREAVGRQPDSRAARMSGEGEGELHGKCRSPKGWVGVRVKVMVSVGVQRDG